jgi:hypothetical protein
VVAGQYRLQIGSVVQPSELAEPAALAIEADATATKVPSP